MYENTHTKPLIVSKELYLQKLSICCKQKGQALPCPTEGEVRCKIAIGWYKAFVI